MHRTDDEWHTRMSDKDTHKTLLLAFKDQKRLFSKSEKKKNITISSELTLFFFHNTQKKKSFRMNVKLVGAALYLKHTQNSKST